MVIKNPEAACQDVSDFMHLCDAIASWATPRDDLRDLFQRILFGFKTKMGDENWSRCQAQFPPPLRERLALLYGLG